MKSPRRRFEPGPKGSATSAPRANLPAQALIHMQAVNGIFRQHYAGSAVLGFGLRFESAMLAMLGDMSAASALLDEAMQLMLQSSDGSYQAWRFNRLHLDRARIALWCHEPEQALEHLAHVVAAQEEDIPPPQPDIIEHDTLVALAHLEQHDLPAAWAMSERILVAVPRLAARARHPGLEADAALVAGRVMLALGRNDAAQASLAQALALRVEFDDPASPWIAEAEGALARCPHAQGESAAAAAMRARARSRLAALAQVGPQFLGDIEAA